MNTIPIAHYEVVKQFSSNLPILFLGVSLSTIDNESLPHKEKIRQWYQYRRIYYQLQFFVLPGSLFNYQQGSEIIHLSPNRSGQEFTGLEANLRLAFKRYCFLVIVTLLIYSVLLKIRCPDNFIGPAQVILIKLLPQQKSQFWWPS